LLPELLKQLGGFDEQFYYYFEDVDLCHRVWDAGYSIVYTPNATITHLSGQSVKSFHLAFELDKLRNRYRYFYKYFGAEGVRRSRLTVLAWLYVRILGCSCMQLTRRSPGREQRITMYRVLADWNRRLDPVALVLRGAEPQMTLHEPVNVPTVDHPSMQAEGGK
jgi:GT2 family glycosyltransferase